jgi:hypothetical protein
MSTTKRGCGSILITIMGITAAVLFYVTASSQSDKLITIFAGMFAIPAAVFTLLGSIICYWKRRFGGVIMFIGAIPSIGLLPFGVMPIIGMVLVGISIIASFWHVLPD